MATANPTAPAVAHSRSLDLPAVIAGSVDLLKLSEALTRAGLIGRYDADRSALVIEPATARPVVRSEEDARIGMRWFNSLTPAERRYWLEAAGSAVPADAWRAFRAGMAGPL